MRTIIIAEAGVNHNGDLGLAKGLVAAAAAAGADFVKFQTFKAERLVTKQARKAEYQIHNTGSDDSQYDMLKALELTDEMHLELVGYSASQGIRFLSTPFDEQAAAFLQDKVDVWKVASGELTNQPFIRYLVERRKPIILSTGMATLEEVQDAVAFIRMKAKEFVPQHDVSLPDLTVLHCSSSYPALISEVNLRAMVTMANELGVAVGYSDHTVGLEVPIAAVAMGARVIEKHITLDRNLPGPDQKASMEVDDFATMVKCIRNLELAMGTGIKAPSQNELKTRMVARKSLHYAHDLKRGTVLDASDLSIKRPGNGLAPKYADALIGKVLGRDVIAEQLVELSDMETK